MAAVAGHFGAVCLTSGWSASQWRLAGRRWQQQQECALLCSKERCACIANVALWPPCVRIGAHKSAHTHTHKAGGPLNAPKIHFVSSLMARASDAAKPARSACSRRQLLLLPPLQLQLQQQQQRATRTTIQPTNRANSFDETLSLVVVPNYRDPSFKCKLH